MSKFIIALIYTAAFSSAVLAQYEYENKGLLRKTAEGRQANTDAVSGEEMQKRLLKMDEQKEEGSTPAAQMQRIQVKPQDATVFETPGDALARFNNTKRTGNGSIQHEVYSAANCVPLVVKGRNPASVGGVSGFRCTKIYPGSGFAKAGILDGDIIKSVDGKRLNSGPTGPRILEKIENSDYSQITIVREGREEILAAPLR